MFTRQRLWRFIGPTWTTGGVSLSFALGRVYMIQIWRTGRFYPTWNGKLPNDCPLKIRIIKRKIDKDRTRKIYPFCDQSSSLKRP